MELSPTLLPLPQLPSTLGYVILALLAAKPQSGYDLARQMKPSQGFLWQARHSQIYPELARLTTSGLVAFQRVDQRSGPPRRVHSVTPKGRAELASWIGAPPQSRATNDELVVKAYAMQRISAEKAVAMLREELGQHERRLGSLEVFVGALDFSASKRPAASPGFGEYAALRRAIGAEREYISWCRWLIGELTGASKPRKARPRGAPAKRQGAKTKVNAASSGRSRPGARRRPS